MSLQQPVVVDRFAVEAPCRRPWDMKYKWAALLLLCDSLMARADWVSSRASACLSAGVVLVCLMCCSYAPLLYCWRSYIMCKS